MIPISLAQSNSRHQLFAKLENRQLGRSTYARVAFSIVKTAILEGKLEKGRILMDKANTQMALAYGAVCARLSISLKLIMNRDNTTPETLVILKAFGVLTELVDEEQIDQRLAELQEEEPDLYFFANREMQDDAWKVHYLGTAKEIYHQTHGQLTHFVADASQRSLLLGTGKKLKEVNQKIQLIALEQRGREGAKKHPYADATISVDATTVDARIESFAKEAGMMISRQSAINLIGLETLSDTLDEGVVVTIFPNDPFVEN